MNNNNNNSGFLTTAAHHHDTVETPRILANVASSSNIISNNNNNNTVKTRQLSSHRARTAFLVLGGLALVAVAILTGYFFGLSRSQKSRIANSAKTTSATSTTETPALQTPVTWDDMTKLEQFLKAKVASNIPKILRASFHDLITFDTAKNTTGGQGCIVDDARISNFDENKGLQDIIPLVLDARNAFPGVSFSTGDIVSLAGKVAVESAYPCLKIGWGFGRPSCQPTGREQNDGPVNTIKTVAEYKSFSDRYKFTTDQFAILTTGAHAVRGAVNRKVDTGIHDFRLANSTDPIGFIQRMLNPSFWVFKKSWFQGSFDLAFGRFISDFAFFPSTLRSISGAFVDESTEAAKLEQMFKNFTTSATGQSQFLQRFGKAYEKLLTLGTSGLTAYSESSNTC